MRLSLRIVKEKPGAAPEQKTRDANDALSSFPNAKEERKYPVAKEIVRRGPRAKNKKKLGDLWEKQVATEELISDNP